ncbi:MAG: aminotransferase class I/II-fold pyridoxal phosphate-dependent enzyme [Clostridiales bacterium]|jgi:arginine/lysine/ornithine decarboxylase|nr:aminotransferase class I/II-fold pyridoxal phosphate-dependent enzyme [Clostridiales bacterium]
MKLKTPILDCIKKYKDSNPARFHTPGHQGVFGSEIFLSAGFDITELPFSDNLLCPSGVIAESERQAAEFYGSEGTLFFTNGATSAIFAAVAAAASLKGGKKILIGKNCHKSVFSAAAVCGLTAVFYDTDEDGNGGFLPAKAEDIESALKTCGYSDFQDFNGEKIRVFSRAKAETERVSEAYGYSDFRDFDGEKTRAFSRAKAENTERNFTENSEKIRGIVPPFLGYKKRKDNPDKTTLFFDGKSVNTPSVTGDRAEEVRAAERGIFDGKSVNAPSVPGDRAEEIRAAEIGIFDGINVNAPSVTGDKYEEVIAVVVTSPDYFGRCADLKEIYAPLKKRGILLIVDGAHGAHFAFSETLPEHPVKNADFVVDGCHKTMPVYTGGALLHCGSVEARLRGEFFRSVFHSASPQYLTLASIDFAIAKLAEDGEKAYAELYRGTEKLKNTIKNFGFRVMTENGGNIDEIDEENAENASKIDKKCLENGVNIGEIDEENGVNISGINEKRAENGVNICETTNEKRGIKTDFSRLVIDCSPRRGEELKTALERKNIFPETAYGGFVVFILSPYNISAIDRLENALREISSEKNWEFNPKNGKKIGEKSLENSEKTPGKALKKGEKTPKNGEKKGEKTNKNGEKTGEKALKNSEKTGEKALKNDEKTSEKALKNSEKTPKNGEKIGEKVLKNGKKIGEKALKNSEKTPGKALKNSEKTPKNGEKTGEKNLKTGEKTSKNGEKIGKKSLKNGEKTPKNSEKTGEKALKNSEKSLKNGEKIWEKIPISSVEKSQNGFLSYFQGIDFVGLTDCLFRISAAEVGVYPPGIPTVVKGDTITPETLEYLLKNKDNLFGLTEGRIAVFKKFIRIVGKIMIIRGRPTPEPLPLRGLFK